MIHVDQGGEEGGSHDRPALRDPQWKWPPHSLKVVQTQLFQQNVHNFFGDVAPRPNLGFTRAVTQHRCRQECTSQVTDCLFLRVASRLSGALWRAARESQVVVSDALEGVVFGDGGDGASGSGVTLGGPAPPSLHTQG